MNVIPPADLLSIARCYDLEVLLKLHADSSKLEEFNVKGFHVYGRVKVQEANPEHIIMRLIWMRQANRAILPQLEALFV